MTDKKLTGPLAPGTPAGRAHELGYFLVYEVAFSIAKQKADPDTAEREFRTAFDAYLSEMQAAGRRGALKLRNPDTDGMYHQDNPREWKDWKLSDAWVSVEDVNTWLSANDAPASWKPSDEDMALLGKQMPSRAGVLVHMQSFSKQRRNVMDAPIDTAIEAAGGSIDDWRPVWIQLEALADRNPPPAPLQGVVPGGVQYLDEGVVRTFNKKSLQARLNRRRLSLEPSR